MTTAQFHLAMAVLGWFAFFAFVSALTVDAFR